MFGRCFCVVWHADLQICAFAISQLFRSVTYRKQFANAAYQKAVNLKDDPGPGEIQMMVTAVIILKALENLRSRALSVAVVYIVSKYMRCPQPTPPGNNCYYWY